MKIIAIILGIILYLIMWVVVSVGLARWSKNPSPEWIGVGMVWPLAIVCLPFVLFIVMDDKLIRKYGK